MRLWLFLWISIAIVVAIALFSPALLHYLGQIKHYLLALLGALFLYKGKFIAAYIFQKIIRISAKELSKRYVIEYVVTKRLKEHLITPAKEDVVRIVKLWKKRAKKHFFIGLVVTALSAFFGSALFVRVMGFASVIKVLMAKFWSMVLKALLLFMQPVQKVLSPLMNLYKRCTLFHYLLKPIRLLFDLITSVVFALAIKPLEKLLSKMASGIKRYANDLEARSSGSIYQRLRYKRAKRTSIYIKLKVKKKSYRVKRRIRKRKYRTKY